MAARIFHYLGLTGLTLTLCAAAAPTEAPDARGTQLLDAARAATGGAAWDKIKEIEIKAKRQDGDNAEDEESWLDVVQGRMVVSLSDGPQAGRVGFDGKTAWTADVDGASHAETAAARGALIAAAYWRTSGWIRPLRAGATATWLRDETQGGRGYDVVHVIPAGGSPLDLWLDRANHLPVRIASDDKTIRLSQWRKQQGVSLPWRIEIEVAKAAPIIETVTNIETQSPLDPNRYAMPTAPAVDYVFPSDTASVPLPVKLRNEHVYVEVRVAKTRLQMLFDTTSGAVLDQGAAQRLGLTTRADGSGGATAKLPEFKVGGIAFRHQTMPVRDLSARANIEGTELDGILGYELAKRLIVELDYDGKRMVLLKPDAFVPPPTATALPITFAGRQATVPGRIDGVPATLTVDTASAEGLVLDPSFAQAHGFTAKWHRAPAILDWDGDGAVTGSIARAASLELGILGVAQPLAAISDKRIAGGDALFGGEALRRFDVILDYLHGKIWLQPNRLRDRTDDYDQSGLWINRADDKPVIAAVLPGSAASRAALKPGDVIDTVGGDKADTLGLSDIRERLTGPAGSAVTMQVDRNGEQRSTRIILADPLAGPFLPPP